MLAFPSLSADEGVANDALHAVPGVDADLGGDLCRRANPQRATVADVRALRALTYDDEVDTVRSHAFDRQWALHPGVEPDRAQVDVLVESEAKPQQQSAFQHATRNARVANSAEQDRVVSTYLGQNRVRQRLAGGKPAAGPQVVLGGVDGEAADLVAVARSGRGDRGKDLEPLGDHLGANAIAPDDRNVQRLPCVRLLRVRINHAAQRRSGLAFWNFRLT